MVSKVQSLKLDTSVWSNEIVQVRQNQDQKQSEAIWWTRGPHVTCVCVAQLFIMLGNDRANDFWAAQLSPSEELDSDASPEQRRDFITQKYRVGRYRVHHPTLGTQEELLKV